MSRFKKTILSIALMLVATNSFAQNSIDTYIYNQAKVFNSDTGELVEDFGPGNRGLIMYLSLDNKEQIGVTLGSALVYRVEVEDTHYEYPEKNVKVEAKQGTAHVENSDENLTGKMTVYRIWNLDIDKIIPYCIRTQTHGANVFFEFVDLSPSNP